MGYLKINSWKVYRAIPDFRLWHIFLFKIRIEYIEEHDYLKAYWFPRFHSKVIFFFVWILCMILDRFAGRKFDFKTEIFNLKTILFPKKYRGIWLFDYDMNDYRDLILHLGNKEEYLI